MSNLEHVGNRMVSGSPYDAALNSTSEKYLNSRMPRVGTKISYDDGSEFVFVSVYNDDMAAGEIVGVGDAIKTEITDACTAAVAGATSIIVDITGETIFGNAATMAVDRMAGGYIVISNGDGEGYRYRVKSNTVQDADAKVTFELYDPLVVAIATTTDIHMIGPKYHGVIAGTRTTTPVGVCMVANTSGTNTRWEYFWVQTKGLAAVHCETASGIAAGEVVSCGASAGCEVPDGSGVYNPLGTAASVPTADDDTLAVWINLC